VTVVAFSDFQCPFCSRAVPTLKQIEDDYKGKVRIAFKQLPLPFHDKAHLAAEAALAAHEQGKFWQMHDKLFANQQALDRPNLEKYARSWASTCQVQGGAGQRQVQGQVDSEAKEGNAVGRPGRRRSSSTGRSSWARSPFEQFKTAIDAELK
jgi:protein-disulfide isomerase